MSAPRQACKVVFVAATAVIATAAFAQSAPSKPTSPTEPRPSGNEPRGYDPRKGSESGLPKVCLKQPLLPQCAKGEKSEKSK